MWRLEYDASPSGDGSMPTEWVRELDELAAPNGVEPLLIWMMREAEARGGSLVLTRLP